MHAMQTVLNGVRLPADFTGCSIINGVAISRDKSRYAVVGADRQLITGDVPDNGILEINGTRITINRGGGGVIINSGFSGASVGGVSINCGKISIGGSAREAQVSQSFVSVSEVIVKAKDGDLTFQVHDGDSVRVEGAAVTTPSVQLGRLDLGDFEGVIHLPRTGVKVAASTMSGDIRGQISSEGSLKTMSGDISLELREPFVLDASTMSGRVDVIGMMSMGRDYFAPPSGHPRGRLEVNTMSGDVHVKYAAHQD